MPMPSSVMEITKRRSARMPVTATGVPGGENAVAFSSSSASRWVTSATALPAMPTSPSKPE